MRGTSSRGYHLYSRRKKDPAYIAIRYVSFLFGGDDILFLSACSYCTFHRIPNFNRYLPKG